MLTMLKNWKGSVTINGVDYESVEQARSSFKPVNGDIHIVLHTSIQKPQKEHTNVVEGKSGEVRITVKQYMTKKASPEFDFMAKWNNDNPMPLRIMVGEKVKETRGMVYMKLHGDIWAKQMCTCMKCGRTLTNPVSQYFGLGVECGGHNYVNPFNSEEELQQAVSEYKAKLQNITWEGWIIKSAITEEVSL